MASYDMLCIEARLIERAKDRDKTPWWNIEGKTPAMEELWELYSREMRMMVEKLKDEWPYGRPKTCVRIPQTGYFAQLEMRVHFNCPNVVCENGTFDKSCKGE